MGVDKIYKVNSDHKKILDVIIVEGNTTINYIFDTNIEDSDPGAGEMKFNDSSDDSATKVWMNDLDKNGLDQSILLSAIALGDVLTYQEGGEPDRAIIFSVTGPAVDKVGYWELPVTVNASGTGSDFSADDFIGMAIAKAGSSAVTEFNETVFKILQDGGSGDDLNFSLSSLTADRTIFMPDNDVNLGNVGNQTVNSGDSPVFNAQNFTNLPPASKVIFSDYIIGATSDPSTGAQTSGTAPVLDEMTKTFTPADATNNIEVFFSGMFSNNKDNGGRCAIFIDGTIEAETEVGSYTANGDSYFCNLNTFWVGNLTAAPHTIDVRFWGTGNNTTGEGTTRKFYVKEIDE